LDKSNNLNDKYRWRYFDDGPSLKWLRMALGHGGVVANGIFVGLSTLDVIYGVDEFPGTNSKIVARSQEILAGGPATNAAVAFSHLGGSPTMVTAIGRHAMARAIVLEFQHYSVKLIDLNLDFDQAPVISSISVNRAGERNVISANATRVHALPAKVDEAALEQANIVMVDGHYMQACWAWARAARARGIQVVLDGGSWKAGTEELLKSVDTAICSADFMPPGCSSQADVIKALRGCGVTNIAITNGAEPIRHVSGTTSGAVRVPRVQVADTMGAGDILHGAYCYYASVGLGFVQALRGAARLATESCRYHGTREWMNYSSDLLDDHVTVNAADTAAACDADMGHR
jgi:sugar/nucleoside kinase (ribokinase family)